MLSIAISLAVAVLGLFLIYGSSKPETKDVGKIMLLCGLLVTLLITGGIQLHLPGGR